MTSIIVTIVWGVWAAKASVTVYEVSDRARLEVDRAPHPVDSPIAGTVRESRLQLDRDIAAGDVLVRLDADAEQLSVREQQEKAIALDAELAALVRRRRASSERVRGRTRVQALLDETRAAARGRGAPHALSRSSNASNGSARNSSSEHDFERGRADALRTRASADGAKLSLVRIEQEQVARDRDRQQRSIDPRPDRGSKANGADRGCSSVCASRPSDTSSAPRRPATRRRCRLASGRGRRGGSAPRASSLPGGDLIAVDNSRRRRPRSDPARPACADSPGRIPVGACAMVDATVARVASEMRDGAVRVNWQSVPEAILESRSSTV